MPQTIIEAITLGLAFHFDPNSLTMEVEEFLVYPKDGWYKVKDLVSAYHGTFKTAREALEFVNTHKDG